MIRTQLSKKVLLLVMVSSAITIVAMNKAKSEEQAFWANVAKGLEQQHINQEAHRKIKSARPGQKVRINPDASAELHIAAFDHNNMDRWSALPAAKQPDQSKGQRQDGK